MFRKLFPLMLIAGLLHLSLVAPEILEILFKMQARHPDMVGSFVYSFITIEYWAFALTPAVVLTAFGLYGLIKFKQPDILQEA